MKYLVTGGAGFIGSYITKRLVEEEEQVVVIDNLNTGKEKNLESIKDKIDFVKGDILDKNLLEDITRNIDGVFHQAALASVQDSFSKPDEYYNVNVNGTENILELAKKNNFKVVYASSSSIYGNPKRIPIEESDEKNPINPYAKTKLEKEELAKIYSKMGVKVIGLRYFNVFGPRQNLDSQYAAVVPNFTCKLICGNSPVIFGDGEQTRDFTYIENVVSGNLLAMTSEGVGGEVFNLATGDCHSVTCLFSTLRTIIGAEGVEATYAPHRKGDVLRSRADVSKAQELMGYRVLVSFEEGLQQTVDWMRA